ncbi:MAG: MDR/zinc-dependent alcohol dehydrogenase-like family protein [Gemmatimonadota bacterium]
MSIALKAARQIAIVEEEPREPAAREVRIRLEGCGVCGSNLPVWEGRPWFEYPLPSGAPGHEGWGRVDAIGSGVAGISEGDRVAALSYRAFAEHDIADADAVVPLPASLDDVAFPGEPLGCVMNVFNRSDIQQGDTVATVGIGFMGALLTQLAARQGARVIALSRRPFALDVARACGASETILMDDHARILEQVNRMTAGVGCDRVIEAVGAQWPLDLAGEITRVRGRLIIAGYHQDGPRQINLQLWNWRGIDVINAHEREQSVYVAGMRAAIQAVERGALDPGPLLTHRFTLDRLPEAFEMMSRRPDGFLKAIVTT